MPAPFPDAAFDTHADPQATSAVGLPGLRHRLSTRIISLSLISLLVVLTMIGGTLWLSWNLEGAGAAINDAGSVRMHANAVAIELTRARAHQPHALAPRIAQLDETLAQLRRATPSGRCSCPPCQPSTTSWTAWPGRGTSG